ncbi:unnamed protein product, partial [marine sediment metagenome]
AGIVAALALSACSGSAASAPTSASPVAGGSITIARLGAEVTNLDPVPDTLTKGEFRP